MTCYPAGMRSASVILATFLAGCGVDNDFESVQIGDARYKFPTSHIRAINTKPHHFVRIRAPDTSFDLVYDSRSARRSDGHGWPMIFSINDGTAPDVDRYNSGNLRVVCRRAVNPQGGCGFVLVHSGVAWSVLLPISQLNSVRQIEQAAHRALEGYELLPVETE